MKLESVVQIDAPPNVVWRVTMDVERWPEPSQLAVVGNLNDLHHMLVRRRLLQCRQQGFVFFLALGTNGKVMLDSFQTFGDRLSGQRMFSEFGDVFQAFVAAQFVGPSERNRFEEFVDLLP